MFINSNHIFKFMYFISAILPINILLVIYILFNFPWINMGHIYIPCFIDFNYIKQHMIDSLFVFFLVILLLSGIIGLVYFNLKLSNIKKNEQSKDKIFVKLSRKYNCGYINFILSAILPISSTFTIKDNVVFSISMVIFFEILTCIFFYNSSDFFPNICLNYAVVIGKIEIPSSSHNKYNEFKNKTVQIFVKKKYLKNILEKEEQVLSIDNGIGLYVNKEKLKNGKK